MATSKNGVLFTYTERRGTSPDFKGGVNEFYRYLAKNIRYPAGARSAGIQGKVLVGFVVEKDGQLTEIKIIRGVHEELDNESLRVIRQSPKWIPGSMFGQPVRVYYTVPIQYAMK